VRDYFKLTPIERDEDKLADLLIRNFRLRLRISVLSAQRGSSSSRGEPSSHKNCAKRRLVISIFKSVLKKKSACKTGIRKGHSSFIFLSAIYVNLNPVSLLYEGASKSSRTGPLERELQIVQLSATRCS